MPVFKQIKIKDRVAQTVMTESAFNDAMGAIVTFAVLGVAMGAGEFSAGDALVDLLKQSVLGIVIGGVLGYLAALLIAHEKFGFLAEYAPVVTLMAVIGAYMGADGAACQRLHGGVRVRHHAGQPGIARLQAHRTTDEARSSKTSS